MRQATWLNNDGVEVGFGTRDTINKETNTVHTKGLTKELKLDINHKDLPVTGAVVNLKSSGIPADAVISSATFAANETFDTAIEVGTMDSDGVSVVADGLIATGIYAAGDAVVGAGAQIGTQAGELLYVAITPTTTAPTTGRGQLVVEYILNNSSEV